MTAGKGTPANHEFALVAQRLASFAAGCLGTTTPAKTGSRLGVMGNVSEAELHEILRHIEVLSKQRAAGLAGQSGYPDSEPDRSGSSFQQALKEACGVDADHIHLYLPKDAVGKVDLIHIFRMEEGKAGTASSVPPPSCDAFADFVDHPSDLPKAEELPELSREVDETHWLQDTVAINALRSALFHKVQVKEVDDLLLPVSRRCRSRRPALCKTALRGLAELAADAGSKDAWTSNAAEMVAACLAAMQVTKVTAKMGEETLDALCRRLQTEGSPPRVVQVLSALDCPEVRHPTCVAALLRVMGSCLSSVPRNSLKSEGTTDASDATLCGAFDEASAFCEEVLKNRRLSPAFSEARAALRQLAEIRSSS